VRFLADENVERLLVDALRADGHDIVQAQAVSENGDDEAVLSRANTESRILLTNDKDFGELVFRLGRVSTGIVLIRMGTDRTGLKVAHVPRVIAREGQSLLRRFTVIGDARVRRRPLVSH